MLILDSFLLRNVMMLCQVLGEAGAGPNSLWQGQGRWWVARKDRRGGAGAEGERAHAGMSGEGVELAPAGRELSSFLPTTPALCFHVLHWLCLLPINVHMPRALPGFPPSPPLPPHPSLLELCSSRGLTAFRMLPPGVPEALCPNTSKRRGLSLLTPCNSSRDPM